MQSVVKIMALVLAATMLFGCAQTVSENTTMEAQEGFEWCENRNLFSIEFNGKSAGVVVLGLDGEGCHVGYMDVTAPPNGPSTMVFWDLWLDKDKSVIRSEKSPECEIPGEC